jgi:hypothetical protein
VSLPVSIVPKGHGPHCFPSQYTRGSHEEQEKGSADGNGVVKGGSVVAGGVGVGELVGESVGGVLVGALVGISVGSSVGLALGMSVGKGVFVGA